MKHKICLAIPFMLAAVLLIVAFSMGASAATDYAMGDANMDGNVNTRDVVLIKQSIVGMTTLTDEQKLYADVYDDGTGTINTRDVVLILQHIVGMDVDLGTRTTITFETNGGGEVAPITQKVGTALTAPPAPTKAGYTFGGWYTNASCTTAFVFGTMPRQNITLYAKWNANSYTITFESNGGSTVAPITQPYNTPVAVPTSPTKTGFTFGGWYADEGLTKVFFFDKMPAENKTLYARWIPIDTVVVDFCDHEGHIIKLYEPDGSIKKTYSFVIEKGESITEDDIPVPPLREGYRFNGWIGSYENVHSNIQIVADYVKQYKVTFVNYDGTVADVQYIDEGSCAVAPTLPERSGYEMLGWGVDLETYRIEADMTLKAQYVRIYTVIFTDPTGKPLKTEKVKEGETATPPEITLPGETATPSEITLPAGYKLSWDTAYDNVSSDLTVTAVYTIMTYSVKYVMPDDTLIDEHKEVKHGSFDVAPEAPAFYLEGSFDGKYAVKGFSGWETTASDVTENITIRAKYEAEYNESLMIVEFSKDNSKDVFLGFYPGKAQANLRGIAFSAKYKAPEGGTIIIDEAVPDKTSNFVDGSQYVVNNNENTLEFAWTRGGNIALTNSFDRVLTLKFMTMQALVGPDSFKVDACSFIVENEDGKLEVLTPIVVYR